MVWSMDANMGQIEGSMDTALGPNSLFRLPTIPPSQNPPLQCLRAIIQILLEKDELQSSMNDTYEGELLNNEYMWS